MDIKYNNGWYLEKFLIRFIKMAITIFWILDICNIPFMQMFDTTYPLNELFWLIVWMIGWFVLEILV